MDSVLEYAKIPVTFQSYAKDQSYAKTAGKPSEPKDTRRNQRHSAVADTVSYTTDKLYGLKNNDYGTFTMYGKLYLLKSFYLGEIYLGKLPNFFRDVRRDKKIDR